MSVPDRSFWKHANIVRAISKVESFISQQISQLRLMTSIKFSCPPSSNEKNIKKGLLESAVMWITMDDRSRDFHDPADLALSDSILDTTRPPSKVQDAHKALGDGSSLPGHQHDQPQQKQQERKRALNTVVHRLTHCDDRDQARTPLEPPTPHSKIPTHSL
ncbi:hypothetical protein NDU88_001977 [Pleurodeles waltl]|uniref:Uncharacterized protein n=1 Tax=Pleurodeles waltl TaxID=8319 RepID=A0AAV7V9X9_PLEWA|nr:hypothetical protein NDU88_001977 [Pleurodeles waltl]